MQIVLENANGDGMVTAEYGVSWAARPRVILYQGQHFEQNRTNRAGVWVYRTASTGPVLDPTQTDPLLTGCLPVVAEPPPPTALQNVLALFELALSVPGPVPAVLVEGLRDTVQQVWPRG